MTSWRTRHPASPLRTSRLLVLAIAFLAIGTFWLFKSQTARAGQPLICPDGTTNCSQTIAFLDKTTGKVVAQLLIPDQFTEPGFLGALDCHNAGPDTCWLAVNGGLVKITVPQDGSCTAGVTVVGGSGNSDDALAFDTDTGVLYSARETQFGTYSQTDGSFTKIGTGFGSGTGSLGVIHFTPDFGGVDERLSLTYDHATGSFYATFGQSSETGPSFMMRIDPTTGAIVPGGMSGADYVVVHPLGARGRVSGITLVNGTMYGTMDNTGLDARLVTINLQTGVAHDLGSNGLSIPVLTSLTSNANGDLFALSGAFQTPKVPCAPPHPHTTLKIKARPSFGRVPLTVLFTYRETNDGSVPITGVTVSDDLCGAATLVSGDDGSHQLKPDQTWVFTCTHTFTTGGTFTDHARATGTDPNGASVPESAETTILVNAPHTTLKVTATPTTGRAPLSVLFLISETNDGNSSIAHVHITDDICGTVHYVSGDNGTHRLNPGETWIFACTHVFDTPGTFTDHFTATGDDEDGPVPPEDTPVTVTVISPHTTLTVSADPATGVAPLTVVFTYHEKNDGNDPVSGVTVSDDLCGTATLVSGDDGSHELKPGQTWVFTCTQTFTTAGTFGDHASATGMDPNGGSVPETAGTQVTVIAPHPHTHLSVTASPASGRAPLTVVYTYAETNDGNTTISGVVVTDDICGTATFVSGDTDGDGMLNPGETWIFTCTHVFTAAGTFIDHVTATGNDANGPVVPENATATVTALPPLTPATSLTVVATPATGTAPLTVTYTYTEKNTGNVAISNVTLTDLDGICSPITFVSGDTNGNGMLDPGETWTFTCTHVFTSGGSFTSHVNATGVVVGSGAAAPVEAASVTVGVTAVGPISFVIHTMLSVTVTPVSGTVTVVSPGVTETLTVTYTYSETNDGNVPIAAVKIVDDGCANVVFTGGDTNGNGILDPGETWTYTCSRTFDQPGNFTNHVTATGINTLSGAAAPPETATANEVVTAVAPLRVVRTATQPILPVTGLEGEGRLAQTGLGLILAGSLAALIGQRRRRRGEASPSD